VEEKKSGEKSDSSSLSHPLFFSFPLLFPNPSDLLSHHIPIFVQSRHDPTNAYKKITEIFVSRCLGSGAPHLAFFSLSPYLFSSHLGALCVCGLHAR
jgi:hypothetical protein